MVDCPRQFVPMLAPLNFIQFLILLAMQIVHRNGRNHYLDMLYLRSKLLLTTLDLNEMGIEEAVTIASAHCTLGLRSSSMSRHFQL